ncbi:MAG TPA: peptidylprolyl isomerase [Thermoanaerobaculia bacterium]|nr:peptidylprolyl isomerase [Thermoanaerobaculia bacterium]
MNGAGGRQPSRQVGRGFRLSRPPLVHGGRAAFPGGIFRQVALRASLAPLAPLVAAALLLADACRRPAPPAPDVVARIGQTEVRYSEFQRYLSRTVGDAETVLASDVLSQLFDQFLREKLLVRLAVERGLAGAGARAVAPRQAIDALLAGGLREPPGTAEIERYYRQHRQEFSRPERVRLRQILTEDRKTAEQALREIQGGADFALVARRLSRDPSANAGGYQGELSRRELPPAFVDVIFGLRPGEVSRVVAAEYGFHLFQVIERLPDQVVPLAAAQTEVAGRLRRERADSLLGKLVEEGRARYNIVAYERNLPFNYGGAFGDSHAAKPATADSQPSPRR